jgi:hypothetical protein
MAMSLTPSERRFAENEVVFRSFNERLQKDIDNVNKIAAEEGDDPISLDGAMPLYFFCECSDETCSQRIRISPDIYQKIHKTRDVFTIVPGHQIETAEDVIAVEKEYCVVKKHKQPPQTAGGLQSTGLNNS